MAFDEIPNERLESNIPVTLGDNPSCGFRWLYHENGRNGATRVIIRSPHPYSEFSREQKEQRPPDIFVLLRSAIRGCTRRDDDAALRVELPEMPCVPRRLKPPQSDSHAR